jgi:hypothetical protein
MQAEVAVVTVALEVLVAVELAYLVMVLAAQAE